MGSKGVAIMCFERKSLLQDERAAWDEFRRMRDSRWSSDGEIVRAHDIALTVSRKLRDHLAICEECSEGGIHKALAVISPRKIRGAPL